MCKLAPAHAAEALECLGGNGYVEESGMPRLYREAPLQSIWEGSGNVAALDALRALTRQPETAEAFFAELDQARGRRPPPGRRGRPAAQGRRRPVGAAARRLAESLAVTLQASLLIRHGSPRSRTPSPPPGWPAPAAAPTAPSRPASVEDIIPRATPAPHPGGALAPRRDAGPPPGVR